MRVLQLVLIKNLISGVVFRLFFIVFNITFIIISFIKNNKIIINYDSCFFIVT